MSSITPEAIDKIISLAGTQPPVVTEIDGFTYVTGKVTRIEEPVAEVLKVKSLTAVIDFCDSQLETGRKYAIHIVSADCVRLMSAMDRKDRSREVLLVAERPYKPFQFGNKFAQEEFVVSLQTQFCQDGVTAMLVGLSSSVTEDQGVTAQDNGVTQTVTVRKGVQLKDHATVPNPVVLAPYRTFAEVEQPSGPFVFRVHDGIRFSLTEADGGTWIIQAVDNIRKFLTDNLEQHLAAGILAVIG